MAMSLKEIQRAFDEKAVITSKGGLKARITAIGEMQALIRYITPNGRKGAEGNINLITLGSEWSSKPAEPKVVFVNVYKNDAGQIEIGNLCDTAHECDETRAEFGRKYLYTERIEFTEEGKTYV